jgi:hypothetical protein
MNKKTSQRGANGSAGPNGSANDSAAAGAHGEAESSQLHAGNEVSARPNGNSSQDNGDAVYLLRRTEVAAIQDGAAFFDAVAARADLVEASVRLIINEDLKISKAELDRLREMKFGKPGASVVEEPPELDFSDWPRRNRERP